MTYRDKYQSQFADLVSLQKFHFQSFGAAMVLQAWFHGLCWRRYHKYRWRHKYTKMIHKFRHQKIFYRAVKKCLTIVPFIQADLDDPAKCRPAAAIIIQRRVRGMLGRARFHRIRLAKASKEQHEQQAILTMQSFFRRMLVIMHYTIPQGLGWRYRMLQRKERQYYAHLHQQLQASKDTADTQTEEGQPDHAATGRRPSFLFTTIHFHFQNEDEFHSMEASIVRIQCCLRRYLARGQLTEKLKNHQESLARKLQHWWLYIKYRHRLYRVLHLLQPFWRRKAQYHIRQRKAAQRIQSLLRIYWKRQRLHEAFHIRKISARRISIWMRYRLCYRRYVKNNIAVRRSVFERSMAGMQLYQLTIIHWLSYYTWQGVKKTSKAPETIQHELQRIFAVHSLNNGLDLSKIMKLMKEMKSSSLHNGLPGTACGPLFTELDAVPSFTINSIELQFTKVKGNNDKRIDYSKFLELLANISVVKFFHMDPPKGCWEEKVVTIAMETQQQAQLQQQQQAAATQQGKKRASKIIGRTGGTGGGGGTGGNSNRRGSSLPPQQGGGGRRNSSVSNASASSSSSAANLSQATMTAVLNPTAFLTTGGTGGSGGTSNLLLALNSYRYGGLTGKAAFITRFLNSYGCTLSDYTKAEDFLGPRSARQQMMGLLTSNVAILQSFVRHRLMIRGCTRWLAARKTAKKQVYLTSQATIIQSLIRMFLSKRRVMKLAQSLYAKFVDGSVNEQEYWSNPRTGQSYWTKPFLLGAFDCGLAVRMPIPEEMILCPCNICERNHATSYCTTCKTAYCTPCYAKGHAGGTRRFHSSLLIDHCIQCDFQIATCYCFTCQDVYCDSCYHYMHRKGRYKYHAFQRYTQICSVCTSRSAQYIEYGYIDDKNRGSSSNSYSKSRSSSSQINQFVSAAYEKAWCMVCYLQAHPEERQLPLASDTAAAAAEESSTSSSQVIKLTERKATSDQSGLRKILYYGKHVQVYQQQIAQERKALEMKELYARRQVELQALKRVKACMIIQRNYRGYVTRRRLAAYIEGRKELMLIRKDEDNIRESFLYKLRGWLGISPILKSDTPLERVKKLYPWYMHHLIGEAIEYQWSEAVHLLVEHEQYLAALAPYKATRWEKITASFNLKWSQQSYAKLAKKLQDTQALVDSVTINYDNAKASGAFTPEKLKSIKKMKEKLEKTLASLTKQELTSQQELQSAEKREMDCYGPLGLQKLIQDRQQHGVKLPFKISIRHNSRLALVEWTTTVEQQPPTAGEEQPSNYYYDETTGEYVPLPQEDIMGTTGSNAAPLPATAPSIPKEPGAWKKKLKTGDRIYLQGISYQVSTPFVAARPSSPSSSKRSGSGSRPGSASVSGGVGGGGGGVDNSSSGPGGGGGGQDNSGGGGGDNSSGGGGGGGSSRRRRGGRRGGNDASSGTGGGGDNSDSKSKSLNKKSSATTGTGGAAGDNSEAIAAEAKLKQLYDPFNDPLEEKELHEVCTEDHITLDHVWLFDDAFGIDIYKKIPTIFYKQPLHFLQRQVIRFYPVQKIIAILAITSHKLARLCDYFASFFDDDTDSHAYFASLGRGWMKTKNDWLAYSQTIVQMKYDFFARKLLMKYLFRCGYRLWQLLKLLYNMYATVNSQHSLEKVDLRCMYEMNAERVMPLGEFRMDLGAPVEIMREYIDRNFRVKLNEMVGESFLFLKIDPEGHEAEEILPRDDEFKTYSRVYAVKKTDPKTFETFLAVTLVPDPERARVFIKEFTATVDAVSKKGGGNGEDGDGMNSDDEIDALMATAKHR